MFHYKPLHAVDCYDLRAQSSMWSHLSVLLDDQYRVLPASTFFSPSFAPICGTGLSNYFQPLFLLHHLLHLLFTSKHCNFGMCKCNCSQSSLNILSPLNWNLGDLTSEEDIVEHPQESQVQVKTMVLVLVSTLS